MLAEIVAGVLLLSVTAYSTAGGVDFGAGIWDLVAGRGKTGGSARELIDHAMAPVWEVNNVWLVLGIVLCWTGFPALFESAFLNLYPLYSAALLGLILRGSFFAFRHVAEEGRGRRMADLVFGVSSVLTPFFFAASLGAIASGRVHLGGASESVLQVCFNPVSVSFGLVSLAATTLSGASFLVGDARREGATELVDYFRRRAVAAALALVATGTLALVAVWWQVPGLLRAMFSWPAIVFVAATMLLTPTVAFLHWTRVLVWYRTLTVAAAGSLVLAWGFAQSPYLLPGQLTIAQAAAPQATEVLLLVAAAVIGVVITPAIGLLVYLDQRNVLQPPEVA